MLKSLYDKVQFDGEAEYIAVFMVRPPEWALRLYTFYKHVFDGKEVWLLYEFDRPSLVRSVEEIVRGMARNVILRKYGNKVPPPDRTVNSMNNIVRFLEALNSLAPFRVDNVKVWLDSVEHDPGDFIIHVKVGVEAMVEAPHPAGLVPAVATVLYGLARNFAPVYAIRVYDAIQFSRIINELSQRYPVLAGVRAVPVDSNTKEGSKSSGSPADRIMIVEVEPEMRRVKPVRSRFYCRSTDVRNDRDAASSLVSSVYECTLIILSLKYS